MDPEAARLAAIIWVTAPAAAPPKQGWSSPPLAGGTGLAKVCKQARAATKTEKRESGDMAVVC